MAAPSPFLERFIPMYPPPPDDQILPPDLPDWGRRVFDQGLKHFVCDKMAGHLVIPGTTVDQANWRFAAGILDKALGGDSWSDKFEKCFLTWPFFKAERAQRATRTTATLPDDTRTVRHLGLLPRLHLHGRQAA